jgi:hypothetical protein
MSERKNPDYKESAYITNIPEVGLMLKARRELVEDMNALNEIISDTPEVKRLMKLRKELDDTDADIKKTVEKVGGYQDTNTGDYALKQKRVSVSYDVAKTKQILVNFAQAVVEETVNAKKVEGLLKGGLIDQQAVDQISIKTTTEAWIIKNV